jgi:16S rRNA processing protein RimM
VDDLRDPLVDPVVIGFIGPPHGVRGTVRVRPPGTGRHLREGLEPVVAGFRRRILASRRTPKGFLLDLQGVTDRAEAANLRGEEILLDRRELDDLEEDEFYVEDLVGVKVVVAGGETLGEVVEVLETPAYELLLVRNGEDESYIPFTRDHVPEMDLAKGYLLVRPSET